MGECGEIERVIAEEADNTDQPGTRGLAKMGEDGRATLPPAVGPFAEEKQEGDA